MVKKWTVRPAWIGGLLGTSILCAVIVWLAHNPHGGVAGSTLIGSNIEETMVSGNPTGESLGGLLEPELASENETEIHEGTGQLDENSADNPESTTAESNQAQNVETGSGTSTANEYYNSGSTGNGGNKSDNSKQGTANSKNDDSSVQSGIQTAGSSGATTKTGQNSPTQPSAGSGTKQAPAMSDTEFAKVRETIDSYGTVAAKTAGMKINPMMLSLSGLGPDVDAMKEAQASLDKRIDEFINIASGAKFSDIHGKVREDVLAINADIAKQHTLLDKKLSDLKAAKKAANVEKVGVLLKEISENFSAVSESVEKLNAILSSL